MNDISGRRATIGERIKKERKAKGSKYRTQVSLAFAMHTTQNTISNWETGKAVPSMEQLTRLSDLFNCDVTYLLGDYDERSKETEAISDVTGLSVFAIERLKDMQERVKKEKSAGWYGTPQEGELIAINTLLEYGLTVLDYLYQYLYGDYNTYWMLTQGEHGEDKDICADEIMFGYKDKPDGPGTYIPISDARETFMLKIQRELIKLYNLLHQQALTKQKGGHNNGQHHKDD